MANPWHTVSPGRLVPEFVNGIIEDFQPKSIALGIVEKSIEDDKSMSFSS